MDFEVGLRTELQSIASLNQKVFPMNAPEGTKPPFVIYSKSSGEMIKTMDGISKTRSGSYEIDILSDSYSQLQTLFLAVKAKLSSFIGRSIGTGSSGVFVQSVRYDNMIELYENEVNWYRINLEVRIYFEEG